MQSSKLGTQIILQKDYKDVCDLCNYTRTDMSIYQSNIKSNDVYIIVICSIRLVKVDIPNTTQMPQHSLIVREHSHIT